MRGILLVSTCYFHNLVTSRRNILKAQVPGLDAGNKEQKHLRAGILDEGNAYDDYQTNETDKWDPWNLESGEIEKPRWFDKIRNNLFIYWFFLNFGYIYSDFIYFQYFCIVSL